MYILSIFLWYTHTIYKTNKHIHYIFVCVCIYICVYIYIYIYIYIKYVCIYKAFPSNSSLCLFSCFSPETLNSSSTRTVHNLTNTGPTVSWMKGGQQLGTMDPGLPGSHFWLCHLLGESSWPSYLTFSKPQFLNLSEKSCNFSHWDAAKMKIIMYVKHSAWCLAHPVIWTASYS